MVKVREDMTGWKMWEHGVPDSKLIVVRQTEDYIDPKGIHYARWECKCSCGSEKDVVANGHDIRCGGVLSCGCLRKENASNLGKKNIGVKHCGQRKKNKYDLSGDYGIGWTTNTNREFYFDKDDYFLINNYTWFEEIARDGYISLKSRDRATGKNIKMHYLFGMKNCDHINHNTLDNRRINLRDATSKENARNRVIQSNNKSGFIGVIFDKETTKWLAYIKIDGKQIKLGRFIDKEDAIRARLKAEKEYFGEFAPQKYLFEQYEIN